MESRNADARGTNGPAHPGVSGRLPSAAGGQFEGGGKSPWNHAGRRAHHRDLRPRFDRVEPVATRAQSSARAFERALIKCAIRWTSPYLFRLRSVSAAAACGIGQVLHVRFRSPAREGEYELARAGLAVAAVPGARAPPRAPPRASPRP